MMRSTGGWAGSPKLCVASSIPSARISRSLIATRLQAAASRRSAACTAGSRFDAPNVVWKRLGQRKSDLRRAARHREEVGVRHREGFAEQIAPLQPAGEKAEAAQDILPKRRLRFFGSRQIDGKALVDLGWR